MFILSNGFVLFFSGHDPVTFIYQKRKRRTLLFISQVLLHFMLIHEISIYQTHLLVGIFRNTFSEITKDLNRILGHLMSGSCPFRFIYESLLIVSTFSLLSTLITYNCGLFLRSWIIWLRLSNTKAL